MIRFEQKLFFALVFGYSLICGLVLFLPYSLPTGWRMFSLVLIFLSLLGFLILYYGMRSWIPIAGFALLTSLFQVFPDWFLSQVLEVLVFPEDGFPKIGTVSGYMAGLWTLPFFFSRILGQYTREKLGGNLHFWVGVFALIIFWISEETMHLIPVWYGQDVKMIGSAAVYVLPAEFLLGIFFSIQLDRSRFSSLGVKVWNAGSVSLFYTGALAISYLLIEG
jgi:hypothetical protein